jgi:hypothetical protein
LAPGRVHSAAPPAAAHWRRGTWRRRGSDGGDTQHSKLAVAVTAVQTGSTAARHRHHRHRLHRLGPKLALGDEKLCCCCCLPPLLFLSSFPSKCSRLGRSHQFGRHGSDQDPILLLLQQSLSLPAATSISYAKARPYTSIIATFKMNESLAV